MSTDKNPRKIYFLILIGIVLVLVGFWFLLFIASLGNKYLFTIPVMMILCGLSFCSLLLGKFFVERGWHPERYQVDIQSQILKLKKIRTENEKKSIFKNISETSFYLVVLLLGALVGLWVNSFSNPFVFWPSLVLLFLVIHRYTLKSWKHRHWKLKPWVDYILVVSLILLAPMLNYIGHQNDIALATTYGLLFVMCAVFYFSKKKELKKDSRVFSKEFNKITTLIEKKVFTGGEVRQTQAMVVAIVLMVYIFIPIAFNIAPAEYDKYKQPYIDFLNKHFNNITYAAFGLFFAFSGSEAFSFATNKISFWSDEKHQSTHIDRVVFYITFIFVCAGVVGIQMLFLFIIMNIGLTIFQKAFIICLGFFTFPAWIPRMYSRILALMLYLFPVKENSKNN